LIKELSLRGYSIDFSDFLRLFPKRWRSLISSAVLLPSNVKTCLPHCFRALWSDKFNTFESLLLKKKVSHFSDTKNIWGYTHSFVSADPTKQKVRGNPYIQIGLSNSGNYPVRHLGNSDDNTSNEVLVGSGWIAYDPECWPEGLPNLKDRKFSPGPSWKKGNDDVILRYTFQEMNKLLPGWFEPKCNNLRFYQWW
jgi:hypothetical protein